jgi:hypothetical protein
VFLVFIASMFVVQISELRYDLGSKTPIEIDGVEKLQAQAGKGTIFASVRGKPNFQMAFIYQRYGLSYTYFLLEPYHSGLVVRTYETVGPEWEELTRFVGKLRPFDDQPFSYAIERILLEQFGEKVPPGAFFLGLYDVPKLSGWQVGAMSFALVLWAAMFYLFFFFHPKHRPQPAFDGAYPEQERRRGRPGSSAPPRP